ncbi:MAG: ADP-forming succinate--CoA ligase subunit beta [Spirochaetales bacterium]|nr:ADP-forming succinate--CoA ligase subunit beta [Spirochaetales bacterium]
MKMYEYQATGLFAEEGIPVLSGELVCEPKEAAEACRRLGGRVVLKAQVLTGGRGKAGGVATVSSPEEAVREAERILSLTIKGYPVKKLLVVPAADIREEYYLGLTIDRNSAGGVCILSSQGGMDIEELAATAPEKILRLPLISDEMTEDLSVALRRVFPRTEVRNQAEALVKALIRLFRRRDCLLAEINPLALDCRENLIALDAKVEIDDNALFLHKDLAALKEDETAEERSAREGGISFISLDGTIGCVVNGAGLAMATMDAVHHFGAEPANFLDVGGSSDPKKMVLALNLIVGNPRVRCILINIFGGITRCDDIARGILLAAEAVDPSRPLVIRLTGTNAEEGKEMLEKAGYAVMTDMTEAVKKAVALAGGPR